MEVVDERASQSKPAGLVSVGDVFRHQGRLYLMTDGMSGKYHYVVGLVTGVQVQVSTAELVTPVDARVVVSS